MDVAPDEIEREFNPRLAAADFAGCAKRAAQLSEDARSRLRADYDVRYDSGPLGTLDVFPADQPGAPVHVFFHGGFWRGRDKADYSYVAAALVPAGITTVVINYDLCPQVKVAEIVSQAGRGLRWVEANAASFGGNPDRITASGHSAGAHLIAMALATDRGEKALPEGLLKGAVLISGIYDLAPVPQISVNEQVRLDASEVDAVSPMFHLPHPAVPLEIVVGGRETPSWIEQSRCFSKICKAAGGEVRFQEIADHDHFSIMTLMEKPEGDLTRSVLDIVKR